MGIIKQVGGLNLPGADIDQDADLLVCLAGGTTKKLTLDELAKYHSYMKCTRSAYTDTANGAWTNVGSTTSIATDTQRPSSGTTALRGSGGLGTELCRIETASMAGTYWVNLRVTFQANANGSRAIEISQGTTASGARADHTLRGKLVIKAHDSTSSTETAASAMVDLSVGDTVKGWVYQNSGSTKTYGSVVAWMRRVR